MKRQSAAQIVEMLVNDAAFCADVHSGMTRMGLEAKYRRGTLQIGAARDAVLQGAKPAQSPQELSEKLLQILKRTRKAQSVEELCDRLDCAPSRLRAAIDNLAGSDVLARISNGHVMLGHEPGGDGAVAIDSRQFFGKRIRFGAVGDSHLCSVYERLDVQEAIYDILEQEKITTVYHTGNFIDGEARFNRQDIHVHGMDNQLRYFADKYPKRKGITTHFIAGDDHEGWYVQREGVEIGKYAERICHERGRDDLNYIGYMERDIELKAENGSALMRVVHPGGGSAYAISYTTQKLIESLSGGEKPQIMLIGHYHKAEYICYRNVHAVQTGTGCDQTPFMRKKRLAAHVGGWICEATQAADGSITRFRAEFINFFDRGYYAKPWAYRG